jgi:uncharacterized protein YggE
MKFWQQIKNPLLTAVFVLIGLLLWSNFSYMLPFGSRGPVNKDALFTVEGTAETSTVPDTALLYLGVTKRATTPDEAKSEANKVINKITEDLKKAGIPAKDIKTTNFSVNEDYDNNVYTVMPAAEESMAPDSKAVGMPIMPRKTKTVGYIANANIEVRTKPIEKANQAVDLATQDGATQVGATQFVLDDEKQKELENQTRLEAIKNAKEKATEMSKAAGIRLGRVISVQENGGGGYPRPVMMMKTADSAAGSAPTDLNPGENTVTMTVTLSFETY